jgi:preprotein translocase subunit SecA
MHVQVVSDQAPAAVTTTQQVQQVQNVKTSGTAETTTKSASSAKSADDWSKTPRNAPCPCGSGKKYKQCHGRVA